MIITLTSFHLDFITENPVLLVWRLNNSSSFKNGNCILESINQETMNYSAHFSQQELFVSDDFIVTTQERQLQNEIEKQELLIEVRSTSNFSVVYSNTERGTVFNGFSFVNDILAIQIISTAKNYIRYETNETISQVHLKANFENLTDLALKL